jgi:Zn finger protein HypA/HybF involved in hydrogenase expression
MSNVWKEVKAIDFSTDLRSNPMVQLILAGFADREISVLKPTLDTDKTPRYVVVENVTRLSPEEIVALLERMAESSILKKHVSAKVISCPKCGSASQVFDRFECPRCSSIDISVRGIYENLRRGTIIALDAQVEKEENGEDLRKVGSICRCHECKASFDEPVGLFYCESCQLRFRFQDAKLHNAYSYEVNEVFGEELRRIASLTYLREVFLRKGFEAQLPGALTGASGISHDYTLVAKVNDCVVVIDVVRPRDGKNVSVEEVLAFYGKNIDVQPSCAVLIAIPSMSIEAKKLANANGIRYIEASDPKEAAVSLETYVATPMPISK